MSNLTNNDMELSELRIGNYIDTGDFHIKGLKGIYQYNPKWWKYIHMFKPVTLTEQWLKDFGFIISNISGLIMKYPFYAEGNPEKGYILTWGYGGKNASEIRIKYVHQLQNLYFALTTKELTK